MNYLKWIDIGGSALNCLLSLSILSLPDVTFINPSKALEPTIKDGEGINRLHVKRGNPYPNTRPMAGTLLLVSGTHLILKLFGIEAVQELGTDILNIFQSKSIEAIALASEIVPSPTALKIKSPLDDAAAPDDLIKKFIKYPNCAVIGKSGTGKTTALQAILSKYLQSYPNAEISILDKNAGKEGNDWLGLMMGDKNGNKVVWRSPDDIYLVISSIHEQLEKRAEKAEALARQGKKVAKFPPILCIFDEFPTTSLSILPEDKPNGKYPGYLNMIKQILLEGRGYNIKFIIGMQQPDTGTAGLPQVFISGLSKLWLVHEQLSNKEIKSYFPLDDSDSDQQILTKLNQLKRTGKRCALLNIDGEKHAILTPDFQNIKPIISTNEQWWEQTITNNQEQFTIMIKDYLAGARASPLKEICKIAKIETRQEDPRYSDYLKPWFDSQIQSLKQLEVTTS